MVEFALQRLRGTDDGWNSFLAGTIAGLTVLSCPVCPVPRSINAKNK